MSESENLKNQINKLNSQNTLHLQNIEELQNEVYKREQRIQCSLG
jgi:hypothetical protein